MIALLARALGEQWQILWPLRYITVRAVLAAGLGFLLALVLGGWCIRRLRENGILEKAGASDCPEVGAAARAAGKDRVPTMGGVFWTTTVLLTTLLLARPDAVLVILGAVLLVGMGTIGFFDDWIKYQGEGGRSGLSRTTKLWATIALASYVALLLWLFAEASDQPGVRAIYFPVLKDLTAAPAALGLWGLPIFAAFTALVVLASGHAANIADGMDGLAAGAGLVAYVALGIACYAVGHAGLAAYLHLPHIPGAGEVAILAAAAVGATLGFLWYNAWPAQVFLGDSGSLPMGALAGYLALVSKQELALPLLAGVYVLDAATSLIQILGYKATGRRLLPKAPIHHHYTVNRGIPEAKVVVRFWIFGLLTAALGLLLIKLR